MSREERVENRERRANRERLSREGVRVEKERKEKDCK